MSMIIAAAALAAAQAAPAAPASPQAGHAQHGQQAQHGQHSLEGGHECCKEVDGKKVCTMMQGHGPQHQGHGGQHQGQPVQPNQDGHAH